MRFHLERGTYWFLQIGSGKSPRAWLTFWWAGITVSLPAGRLLCFRTPSDRPLFSERNGIGHRFILRAGKWRIFIRERA